MKLVCEESQRLDKYLASNTDYSRSTIAKMIDENYVLVNNELKKSSYITQIGDVIELKDGFIKDIDFKETKMDLEIVYEDDYIMVINKPSGLVVHPGAGNTNNTLVNALAYYTNNLSDVNGEVRPGIVHRIDKDTSGLLVVAKTNEAHQILAEYFKTHTNIKREYLALLCGVFPHASATIDAPIGRDEKNRKKYCVTSKNSKEAITNIKVIKRYKEYTLVSCVLKTGRTHQIRVHTQYIGYPIYNDPVYNTKVATDFGQFLHSYKLDLVHPITKDNMHFVAPLPKYFQDFIDSLE